MNEAQHDEGNAFERQAVNEVVRIAHVAEPAQRRPRKDAPENPARREADKREDEEAAEEHGDAIDVRDAAVAARRKLRPVREGVDDGKSQREDSERQIVCARSYTLAQFVSVHRLEEQYAGDEHDEMHMRMNGDEAVGRVNGC